MAKDAAFVAKKLDEVNLSVVENLQQKAFILNTMVRLCHGNSWNAGWYHDVETGTPLKMNIGERLMLIVSELVEGFEANRKDLMDDHLPNRSGIEAELADAVIRIFDLAVYLNLDLGGAIIDKMEYNRKRPDHTIEARKGKHGKKC